MNRQLKNCPKCGKLFVFTTREICPECAQKEDDEFNVVREYILENPAANIDEVSKATGISPSKILKFLREGRLMLSPNHDNLILQCERCGEPILTGRLCKKCAAQLEQEMRGKMHTRRIKGDEDTKGRMYTLERLKNRNR